MYPKWTILYRDYPEKSQVNVTGTHGFSSDHEKKLICYWHQKYTIHNFQAKIFYVPQMDTDFPHKNPYKLVIILQYD